MGAMMGVEAKDSKVKEALEGGACVIDARSAKAYAKDHADGAISVPAGGPFGGKAAASVAAADALPSDKSAAIVCYCDGGAESKPVKKALEAAGYTNVINAGSKARVKKLKK